MQNWQDEITLREMLSVEAQKSGVGIHPWDFPHGEDAMARMDLHQRQVTWWQENAESWCRIAGLMDREAHKWRMIALALLAIAAPAILGLVFAAMVAK